MDDCNACMLVFLCAWDVFSIVFLEALKPVWFEIQAMTGKETQADNPISAASLSYVFGFLQLKCVGSKLC